MRLVLIGFALLAGVKVWTQDRMYRSVMGDALVAAYRERAVAACQKQAAKLRSPAAHWADIGEAQAVIGNANADVAFWDINNPLWTVRFRHPHVVLTATPSEARCAYDVTVGLADVSTGS